MKLSSSFILLLAFTTLLFPQNKELIITSKSNIALQHFIEGRELYENLEITKAAKEFDKAIKLDPTFAMAHLFRALTNVGGYPEIIKHLKQAWRYSNDVTEAEKNFIVLGQAIFDKDLFKQKIALSKLIAEYPKDKRLNYYLGLYYYRVKDYNNAKKYFNNSILLSPLYAQAYNMLGYTELSQKNFSSAEKAFKKYIELLPDKPNPYDSYAEFLSKMGRFNEAIEQYSKAYERDSSFNPALMGIANNYILLKKFDLAKSTLDKLISITDNLNDKLSGMSLMANVFLNMNKTKDARNIFRKIREIAQNNNQLRWILESYLSEGMILVENGQPESAFELFDDAENLVMNSTLNSIQKEFYKVKFSLKKCVALTFANKLSDAEAEANYCGKIISSRNSPVEKKELNDTLALLEIKKGNYSKALAYLKKGNTDNPYNQYYMAKVYKLMGYNTKAEDLIFKVKNSKTVNFGKAIISNKILE